MSVLTAISMRPQPFRLAIYLDRFDSALGWNSTKCPKATRFFPEIWTFWPLMPHLLENWHFSFHKCKMHDLFLVGFQKRGRNWEGNSVKMCRFAVATNTVLGGQVWPVTVSSWTTDDNNTARQKSQSCTLEAGTREIKLTHGRGRGWHHVSFFAITVFDPYSVQVSRKFAKEQFKTHFGPYFFSH